MRASASTLFDAKHWLVNFLAVASLLTCGIQALAQSRPNVIIVMTDDQGYGEFSCHGNPIAETPNIDRLASQSVCLTDFHVSPMCTPTRGQLLTGLDAFRNGAINVSSGRTLLRPELETMADIFQSAGYRTGIFGKWHLGDNYPFRPEDRGFEEALWFPSSHINSVPDYWNNDYFNDTYIHNGDRETYNGYCTDVFFREAMKWMQRQPTQQSPFFAYIPLNAAHSPHFVPDHYRKPIRDVIAKNPKIVENLTPARREALISFLAMGANIDENMGQLDQFLRKNDLFNNTIVVFLTDNGSTFGDTYFNAGMRGHKTQLWEGGHRVPCFIRWPNGKLGKPRDVDSLVHVQDLLPTLAELGQISSIPNHLDGISLAPILKGEQDALADRMLVINYSRMPQFKVTYTRENPAIPHRDGAAVLWKHWRLLENQRLYDLRTDPHQDHNVAATHSRVVKRMQQHLDEWWDGVKGDVFEPQRVIIGHDAENPMLLTACEWLDVFVDQQQQIRRGVRKNGVWHLTVAEPGTYTFELRRWPRESHLRLNANAPMTKVTDGQLLRGRALPIASAKLKIGDTSKAASPQSNGESVEFNVDLEAGPTTMQTWFLDEEGNEIVGAYYVYVERVTPAEKQ
ncbi:arylsulfatase [Thalassoroseus pseudoceratinae]|uniref:arylsulfatase n=1 Tax=Thalassoroseus pseudoceratinae TaxID=2713176 RepID=UPI0014214965|nr:arylsulfatase [Thalassoroseus pseudoceratinae]